MCKGDFNNDIRILVNERPIYIFYYSVYFIKNVRNNLLSRKKFLFPPFTFEVLTTHVNVPGCEISWSLRHRVHEEDTKFKANLRAA